MNVTTNDRGFEWIDFKDHNGVACSVQQSSAIWPYGTGRPGTSLLWLGVNRPVPDSINSGRMHLTRDQVRELLPQLAAWAERGTLKP